MDTDRQETDTSMDGILDISKAEAVRKSIEPESVAQGRIAREGAASFGIFLDIMDRVAQLKHAKFNDPNDLRDFTIDTTIKNKEAHELVVAMAKASAGISGMRVKEVLDTIKNMNRPASPFGILGNLLRDSSSELDIPEEVPVFERV